MRSIYTSLITIFLLISNAYADPVESTANDDLINLSLADLTKVKIYSAAKKEEDPRLSASSVYVITSDDIKKMGVTHLADALATVPGFQVAKINSSSWMVASRGFGEQFSNKLLVLIDGRPIYSTLYSGVFWDQQDIVLDNIKQIEVVRGPGAALWGTNAINGVINIITKSAKDTVGNYINTVVGISPFEGIIEGRRGIEVSDTSWFSASLKARNMASYDAKNNGPYNDSWRSANGTFRYDSQPNYRNSMSLSGSVFQGFKDATYVFPVSTAPFTIQDQGTEKYDGAYLVSKWQHGISDDKVLHLEGYLDYFRRYIARTDIRMVSLGVESQYDFLLFDRYETNIGIGYKGVWDDIKNSVYLSYNPSSLNANFYDSFIQTKFPIIKKKLDLTLGTKFESNTYSNFEVEPSVKLAWYATPSTMLWTSWAHAVRVPSRGTTYLTTYVRATPGGSVSLIPSKDYKSEDVNVYEIGVKSTISKNLYADVTGYYNQYNNLRTFKPIVPFGSIAVPLLVQNGGNAKNYGAEFSLTYQTSPDFKVNIGYTYSKMRFTTDPTVADTVFRNSEKNWPKHMFNVRTNYQLYNDIDWNNTVIFNDEMPGLNIKQHVSWSSNLIWRINKGLDIALIAENLNNTQQQEFSAPLYGVATNTPRTISVRVTANF